jgi:prepilin-type N-terminal cleavage/methylation domain-containing protein/prepilin-type processing-associated H-X9-DG protein
MKIPATSPSLAPDSRAPHPPARGRHPRQRGFTLVEVIVCLAVVALLASLTIPAADRIRASARSAHCSGNLREIGLALSNSFQDKGLAFPVLAPAREGRDEFIEGFPTLDVYLIDYVQDEKVFRCPADHEGFFERTGTSYFWNSLVNGQRWGNVDLFGLIRQEAGVPLVSDKENFHRHVGDGVNILYADGRVQRELQFIVDRRR